MVDATEMDLLQNKRLVRVEQTLESIEKQLDYVTGQVNELTRRFAPFKVLEDVVSDVRKIVEVLREKGII